MDSRDDPVPTRAARAADAAPGTAALPRPPERYREVARLGAGGMGEVALVRDEWLGREVARKQLRPGLAAVRASQVAFERELELQARLEHPAVVPVYDVGHTDDGRIFFTMKRVRGTSLAEVLRGVRKGDAALVDRFGRRRLVDALARAALAVDYAHAQGVLHRDLKPANLMLGDFGEVYVLDWGIACVRADAGAATPDGSAAGALANERSWVDLRTSEQTGTPGYASPEQIAGDVSRLDARADVFSLGAILFEVLAGEPYGRGASSSEILLAMLDPGDPRPSVRAPHRDVPPELDLVCVRALAQDRDQRYPNVHAFVAALERFQDGEKDLEVRAKLAAEHLAAAEEAAERALALPDAAALEERSRAMREVGNAVALEPTNPRALRVIVRLLSERPRHVPPEVEREFERGSNHLLRRAFQLGTACYLSWLFCVPALWWMGILEPWTLACFIATTLGAAGFAYAASRGRRIGPAQQYGLLVLTSLSLALATRGFGPFVVVPTALAVNTLSFAMSERVSRRIAFVAIGTGIALVLPAILEAGGLLDPSYAFVDGTIRILPHVARFPEAETLTVLVGSNLAIIVAAAIWGGVCRDELTQRDLDLLLRKWHLTQMLPDDAGAPLNGRTTDAPTRRP